MSNPTEITVTLPRAVAEKLIRAASVFVVELNADGRSAELLREGQRLIQEQLTTPEVCGVRYGTGTRLGVARCLRQKDHPPISVDGIGHAPRADRLVKEGESVGGPDES